MRAIDADALQIAIVEEGQANKRKKYTIGDIWELTGAEIREVINSQPTIQPEPHWIPVTERLPKDGQYILAYYPEFECGCLVQKYRTIGNYGFVAWMPLPEPFKGVTDGRD